MDIFSYIEAEINGRWRQDGYLASTASVQALNRLAQKVLGKTALSRKRAGRLLFIAAALQLDGLESTKVLTQAQVSAMIEWLKDPESWHLKSGIEADIAEVVRECLKRMGQLELPFKGGDEA